MKPANSASERDAVTLNFGTYPTPLRKFDGPSDEAPEIWIKDDGQSGRLYGGNKVRKLERLLALAQRHGAKRLLTLGAAGSHHVLATCLFGRSLGLSTRAVLSPQPWSPHAEATLRAGLNAGLSAAPAASGVAALGRFRAERQAGDFIIGPGGLGLEGTWSYRLAVDELRDQMAQAGVDQFDGIFVAAGSGSTAAGLLAGVLETGVAKRVIAVQVTPNPALRSLILGQTLYALWRRGRSVPPIAAWRALEIEGRFIGKGYGHPIEAGNSAAKLARSFGLELEPTYTAKAFAAVVERARRSDPVTDPHKHRLHRRRTYLYWHTLSAVPLAALLVGAPDALPDELAQLLRKPYV
jgi:1-aminocyclopropane-1-carboxylate deaminase/D-cysteine desulfhydrase-like pyridoxal-dependent ACC family enzyme